MFKKRLVILAGKGASTNILYNALKDDYEIEALIIEDPVPKKQFLQKRIRKLGIWKVAGQVLFQLSIAKYLNIVSAKRKNEILKQYGLEDSPPPPTKIIYLKSVNGPGCLSLLQQLSPELIVVNGTRIISREVLNCTEIKFINIHAGITPKYRNVHGAYWAIVNNDYANCGVTVHLVDTGIDTGNIIYQKAIETTNRDNFATYPFIQLAEGITLLKKALQDIFSDKLSVKKNALESKIWHHPTLWQYMYYRIVHHKK